MVQFERLDGVAGRKQGAGQGAETGADFLHRFGRHRADGCGDLGGQGGFREKILPELAERAEAAGGQDFLDPGGVQSWRWRMACSSPGLRMPWTSSEPLPYAAAQPNPAEGEAVRPVRRPAGPLCQEREGRRERFFLAVVAESRNWKPPTE